MGDQLPRGPGVRSAFGPDHPAIARPSGLRVSGHKSGRLLVSKGKEGRLCWASSGPPCPSAGPGASGEPAEKQLPWTVAQEDEASGAGAGSARAGAAWEDESLCTCEAQATCSRGLDLFWLLSGGCISQHSAGPKSNLRAGRPSETSSLPLVNRGNQAQRGKGRKMAWEPEASWGGAGSGCPSETLLQQASHQTDATGPRVPLPRQPESPEDPPSPVTGVAMSLSK